RCPPAHCRPRDYRRAVGGSATGTPVQETDSESVAQSTATEHAMDFEKPSSFHHRASAIGSAVNCSLGIVGASQVVSPASARGGSALSVVRDASILIRDASIVWSGAGQKLSTPDAEWIHARGKTVIPGLIDSHTHLIFAGSREDEFEQRLRGASYQEIAARGGGINASMRQVRQSSKDELKMLARRR